MSPRQQAAIVAIVALSVGFALASLSDPETDAGTLVLTMAVLIVATLTLYYVVPRPAQISVGSLEELGINDVIFYIYPMPAEHDETQVPRDFLVQVHVALSNIGGRKCVVSSLALEHFLDADGRPVSLPEVPLPIRALQPVLNSGWPRGHYDFHVSNVHPPYTLDPDDVVVLRFRARRGIDWSERWTLSRLQEVATELARQVTQAEVDVSFRRGGGPPEHQKFRIPITTVQQEDYVRLLEELTLGFTRRPSIEAQPMELE